MTEDGRVPLPDEPSTTPTTERQALVEMLDYYRAVLRRKGEGLTQEQLARTTAASTLTLGGLLKHAAYVEDGWCTEVFAGAPQPEPWASAPFVDDRDWDLHSAVDDMPEDLLGLYDAAIARSRAVVDAAPSLDAVAAAPEPERGPYNLRWILVHLVEEYARHAGHADLLREAVDGTTGD